MPAIRIIGAGIGGLTAGIALRRAGFDVDIFERTPQFSPLGAGIVLAPNALHLLARLGVDVQSCGHPITSVRLRDRRGRTIQESEVRGTFTFDRADLHKALAGALPTEMLHLGQPYTPSSATADGAILIGADGIRSAVRKSGSIVYSGVTCWRGICPNPGIAQMTEDWGGAARVGIVPLNRDRIYVFLVKTAAPGSPRQTNLSDIRADFAHFADPVSAALDSFGSTPLLHHDLEELDKPYWGDGRTILIGDAAHAMTPNLGQGAGMAIEDAVVLPRVVSTANPAAALAELRQARVSEIQLNSRRLGKLAHWESPFLCALRNGLLRAVPPSVANRGYTRMIEAGMKLADDL